MFQEFKDLLGDNFINILSGKVEAGFFHGQVTKDFLKSHISDLNRNIYLCGPPPMMESVEKQLGKMNVKEQLIIKEAI